MNDVIGLLSEVLGQYIKQNNEYLFSCPFCSHEKQKLSINIKKGMWHCWVCGAAGKKLTSLFFKLDCNTEQIVELKKLTSDYSFTPAELSTHTTILKLPPEFIPLWIPNKQFDFKHAMRYTLSRGLTAYDILRYRIGYCAEGLYKNRIIVPSYDVDGKLNYFVARDFYETSELKYKNPKISKDIIAFDMYINWEQPIVLCEGVYDAMSIRRNAIPLLGKTIMPKLYEKIESTGIKSIYLSLDHDAMRDAIKLATKFVQNGYRIYLLDLQEKDPNVIGFEGMQHLIKNATPLTFPDIIRLKVKYEI